MNLVYYFMYLYLILKPYYIFKSGTIQISDVFLLIAFIVLILCSKHNKKCIKHKIYENRYFFYFLIISSIINLIYYLFYLKFKFILSSLYILFNFISIIIFSFSFEDDKFINNVSKIFKINIIIQLLIYLLGFGRLFGDLRYMGTFNDPNQFSYYLLVTLIFIYIIDKKIINKKQEILITIIVLFLIYKSASTGMLMGLLILLGIRLMLFSNGKKVLKITSIFIILFSLIYLYFDKSIYNTFLYKNNDNFVLSRINDKFKRIEDNGSGPSLLEERGYDKILKNPHYILYGAGEGEYYRFKGYGNYEIHATFPSLLFYYGIIPFIFLLIWIYYKLKGNNIKDLFYLIPLFIESFTLLNQRQTLFWAIILFYEFIKMNKGVLKDEKTN